MQGYCPVILAEAGAHLCTISVHRFPFQGNDSRDKLFNHETDSGILSGNPEWQHHQFSSVDILSMRR